MTVAADLGTVAAAAGAAPLSREATTPIASVELDSRAVEQGALFAALPGRHVHGAAFVPQAIARGAVAVLTDPAGAAMLQAGEVPVLVVEDPRAVLGAVSAAAYGTSASALTGMRLLGVTGTNGKTTVNAMVDAGLRAAGLRTALVGTTGTVIAGERIATVRTTPEAPHLHALLARMRDAGVQAAAFEVSSIAIREGRVDGIVFDVAGFSNLTQDHLDYHGTMEAYFLAKAALFTPERARRGIVGTDDDYGRRLLAMAPIPVEAWTLDPGAPPTTWHYEGELAAGPDGTRVPLATRLPGEHNRANAILALGMLRAVGIDAQDAARGIAAAVVPGRMEVVSAPGARVRGIVDYAHSPDAIERVLAALRPSTPGRLIAVVGAGGDRDAAKRPLMGAAAATGADLVIVTDDNPRSEDPAAIRAQLLAGAAGRAAAVEEIGDRAQAIRAAVGHARGADTVVVLGKGHETGQEIAGVMHPFDDREQLAAALAEARA